MNKWKDIGDLKISTLSGVVGTNNKELFHSLLRNVSNNITIGGAHKFWLHFNILD